MSVTQYMKRQVNKSSIRLHTPTYFISQLWFHTWRLILTDWTDLIQAFLILYSKPQMAFLGLKDSLISIIIQTYTIYTCINMYNLKGWINFMGKFLCTSQGIVQLQITNLAPNLALVKLQVDVLICSTFRKDHSVYILHDVWRSYL